VLKWGATDRSVRVGAGPRAILIVRENANAGWQATLNGHRLQSVTVDGWQQGYRLPPHSAGVITLRFQPQQLFAAGMIVGAGAILLLLLLAFVGERRPKPLPALDEVRGSRLGLLAALLGAGFALLGVTGVVLACAAVLGVGALRGARCSMWLAAPALLAVLGMAAAIFPPGSAHSVSDGWLAQALCWLSVALAVTVPLAGTGALHRPRRRRWRSSPYQETAATAVAATDVVRNSTQKWPPKVW
jgi:arabinofuranan 3-O-arabinosyltransferase